MTSDIPSQSNSYQLEDLKTSNLYGQSVGYNDEDSLCLAPEKK